MNPEHWRRAEQIYHAALELPTDERPAFVARQCGSDTTLSAEVRSLLEWHGRSGELFGEGPFTSPSAIGDGTPHPANHELTAGTRVLHYEILAKVGQGGMGIVYKARDTRLERTVAIKLLHPWLASDDARKTLFLHEARAASALNHPGIVVVHDIVSIDHTDAIVMEYIGGPTLADRISAGPLPVAECVRVARQVAEAAARAHKTGIVHCDLKPANIMFTEENAAKILDFGIARLLRDTRVEEGAGEPASAVFGTAAYMSPEQAGGSGPVDARTDIFSLGVILYEMLTGVRPFGNGSSTISALHDLATKTPAPPSAVRQEIPAELDGAVCRMLEKRPELRFQTMDEIVQALDRAAIRNAAEGRRRWLRFMYAAVIGVALALGAAALIWRPAALPAVGRAFTAVPFTAYKGVEMAPSFSPDGSAVAFCWDGSSQGHFDIHVKRLGEPEPRRITHGSGKDVAPSWSPDGRWIAFLRAKPGLDGSRESLDVMLVPSGGGPERTVGRVVTDNWFDAGLAWDPNGAALFVEDRGDASDPQAIYRLSIQTGGKEQITRPPAGTLGDFRPAVDPKGRSLAFVRATGDMTADVYVVDVSGPASRRATPRRLTFDEQYTGNIAWYPDGETIFYSAGEMESPGLWVARAYGAGGRRAGQRVTGVPSAVRHPAISSKKTLVFANYLDDEDIWRVPLRMGRNGPEAAGPPSPLIASNYVDQDATYSPDGSRIAFSSGRSGSQQIWVSDRDGRNAKQITAFEKGQIAAPKWSPDGSNLLFLGRAEGHAAAYVIPAKGGSAQRMSPERMEAHPAGWSADGRAVYFCSGPTGFASMWRKAIAGAHAPVQISADRCGTVVDSAKGLSLYYVRPDDARGQTGSLWRVGLGDGSEQKILDRVYAGSARIGAEGVYFVPGQESVKVQYLHFGTGKIDTIVNFPGHPMWGLSVATDGSALLVTVQANNGSDLMLVEDFR